MVANVDRGLQRLANPMDDVAVVRNQETMRVYINDQGLGGKPEKIGQSPTMDEDKATVLWDNFICSTTVIFVMSTTRGAAPNTAVSVATTSSTLRMIRVDERCTSVTLGCCGRAGAIVSSSLMP